MGIRFGNVISMPNEYSRHGRIKDDEGLGYTIEPDKIDDIDHEDDVAYLVEIWENDSGLVYFAEED